MERASSWSNCCCIVHPNDDDLPREAAIANVVVLTLSSILATLSNFALLFSIWKTPSLHSPSNVFLSSLAVSDMAVGFVLEPISTGINVARSAAVQSRLLCISQNVRFLACHLFCFTSLLSITAISVDMYLALHLHLRYREIVTIKKSTRVTACIWICGVVLSVFYVFFWEALWALYVSLSLLCLSVTGFAYYTIFGVCRNKLNETQKSCNVSNEEIARIARQIKSLMNKFLVYLFFVFCNLTYVIMTAVVNTTTLAFTKQIFFDISYLLLLLNSSFNPLIQFWRSRKIRTAVVKTLRTLLPKSN